MNFGQAISTCFAKYATFSGRASRPEFWWFFLFQVLVSIAASMMGDMLSGLVGLVLLLPALAAGTRRLTTLAKAAGGSSSCSPSSAGSCWFTGGPSRPVTLATNTRRPEFRTHMKKPAGREPCGFFFVSANWSAAGRSMRA